MEFIISIDTEGDNQWDHGRKLTVENVRYVPRFQELCNKFHIKPTYLVTSEICDDDFAKEIFSDYSSSNKAEIGAHLHSWTTPPFIDRDGYRYNDPYHAFATELDEDILNEKILYLTDQIEAAFGKRPTSFRSGRFGFDYNVARVLARNSYLVDSSVTPSVSWSAHKGIPGGKGGSDFIDNTPFPFDYYFDSGSLLEIPVTILPTRFPLNANETIAGKYFRSVNNNLFLKVLRKAILKNQPLWLRPNIWMDINLFEELLNEAIKIKLPYIVMMFHSSELMPGCSAYRQDQESVDQLFDLLESFFTRLRYKNIGSVTLTEAAKSFKI